jgi:hypothetical protein
VPTTRAADSTARERVVYVEADADDDVDVVEHHRDRTDAGRLTR